MHAVPADTFESAVRRLEARCLLGLTATMLREDDRIASLYQLVGLRLYETSWKQLEDDGYLARCQCFHVSCAMPEAFARAYRERGASHDAATATQLAI